MIAMDIAPTIASALVCHREPLIAAATAAVLERRHVVRRTFATSTLTGTLTCLGGGIDVAVVYDDDLGVEDLADLFEAIHYRGIGTPVVIVSDSRDPEYAAQILESGAAGIVPAECPTEDLCEVLVSAHRGHLVIGGHMQGAVLETLRARRVQRREAQARLAALSRADVDILRLLCDGVTVTRIAARLSLSPYTVRGRVRAIGAHLGVTGQLRVAAVGRCLLAALPSSAGGSDARGATRARPPTRRGLR